MGVKIQGSHLGGRDNKACLVATLVELRLDAEAGRGAGVANEFDDRLEGLQWTAAPVLSDVAEEPMLDLVPLARAGREVRDVDGAAQVVGEPLQRGLPPTGPIPVAAARVGGDIKRVGRRVRLCVSNSQFSR